MLGCRELLNGLLFASLILGSPSPVPADEAATRLSIVRSALSDYFTSIRSLTVHGTWSLQLSEQGKESIQGKRSTSPVEWQLVEEGDLCRLEVGDFSPEGIPPACHFYSFDGTHRWIGLDFVKRQADWELSKVLRQPGAPSAEERKVFAAFNTTAALLGLRLRWTDESLVDRLEAPAALYDGETVVESSRCWKFTLGEYETFAGEPVRLSVAIDPTHQFLPRVLHFSTSTKSDDVHITTTEFMALSDSALGGLRWFPKRGVVATSDGDEVVSVTSAAVNTSMRASDFRPSLPDGTIIRDRSNRPGVADHETIVGGPDAVRRVMAEQLAQAQTPRQTALFDANLPRVDASQRPGWSTSDVLFYVCCSGLLILTGVRVYQRWLLPR